MNPPRVVIDVHAGDKGEETLRSFTLNGVRLPVREVTERWHSEFTVISESGPAMDIGTCCGTYLDLSQ